MRPNGLKTRIFLDGGDPAETRRVIELLGFLDGQTTNPTLISKNPEARARLERGEKFSTEEIYDFYKRVVGEISALIPDGFVSVEVYADRATSADAMFEQGKEMFGWIPNAHIKYPITEAGLRAAERTVKEGRRVNMTLCFTQAQSAAVYAATKGAKPGDTLVSPFVGRLDDRGEDGMSLVGNILKMYGGGDGHVQVLAASIRSLGHLLQALELGADIATVPFAVLEEWAKAGMPLQNEEASRTELKAIPYQDISLDQPWSAYDLHHDLTDQGIERFSADWNSLIG